MCSFHQWAAGLGMDGAPLGDHSTTTLKLPEQGLPFIRSSNWLLSAFPGQAPPQPALPTPTPSYLSKMRNPMWGRHGLPEKRPVLKQPWRHILQCKDWCGQGLRAVRVAISYPRCWGAPGLGTPGSPGRAVPWGQGAPHSSPSLGSSKEGRRGHTHRPKEKPSGCRTHTGAPYKKKRGHSRLLGAKPACVHRSHHRALGPSTWQRLAG